MLKLTLEAALQGFASAYKAVKAYKETVAKRLKKLDATLKEKVVEVHELGGKAKDAKAVLEAEEIEFNPDTIDTYFSALTPADEKQNKGGNKNPAAEKGRKAMAETQGGDSATSVTVAVDASSAFGKPFLVLAITESEKAGNPCTAKANASDEDKAQANISLAIATQKGYRAASTAAAKLVTEAQTAARIVAKGKVEAAKVEAAAKADKATASKATGRRNRKPAKAKAKATA